MANQHTVRNHNFTTSDQELVLPRGWNARRDLHVDHRLACGDPEGVADKKWIGNWDGEEEEAKAFWQMIRNNGNAGNA